MSFNKSHFVFIVLLMVLFVLLAVNRCGGKSEEGEEEPFTLRIDSLEITGEVDDPGVSEVRADGLIWPVADRQFSGIVETAGKEKVEIMATDEAENTGRKTIEIH